MIIEPSVPALRSDIIAALERHGFDAVEAHQRVGSGAGLVRVNHVGNDDESAVMRVVREADASARRVDTP